MSHIFISYVHEDRDSVNLLADRLRHFGIEVWMDKEQLKPGERWKESIRTAIRDGAFFLCCFSSNYEARLKSYMNEELLLAIEALRQMPANRSWFIPVRLSPCAIPARPIGGGQTLEDIQWIDLFSSDPSALPSHWHRAVNKIASVVLAPVKKALHSVLESIREPRMLTLRSLPRTDLGVREAMSMVENHDFYEKDWNSLGGEPLPYRCHLVNSGPQAIVAVPSTGLIWQQLAKHFLVRRALTLKPEWPNERAKYRKPINEDHIERVQTVEDQVAFLNEIAYAGFSDWRLPTLEEALSIVASNGRVDYRFGEPRAIWTADFASENENWVVEYLSGGCFPLDILSPMTAHFSVRVIRSWTGQFDWRRGDL